MVDAVSFMARDHRVEVGDIKTKLQGGIFPMNIIRPLLKRMQNGNSWEKGRRKKGIIQQSGTIKICVKV